MTGKWGVNVNLRDFFRKRPKLPKNSPKISKFSKSTLKIWNFLEKNYNFRKIYFHSKAHFGIFQSIKPQKIRCAAEK